MLSAMEWEISGSSHLFAGESELELGATIQTPCRRSLMWIPDPAGGFKSFRSGHPRTFNAWPGYETPSECFLRLDETSLPSHHSRRPTVGLSLQRALGFLAKASRCCLTWNAT